MSKWRLNKVGLVNFWYYQNQEFVFADGKMLLRGSNGSGKSLTMQSLFPVLLDGVTTPARLDSFGSRARKMEDYLLGEKGVSDRDEGIGYLYMELKREDREEYITCGIGLSGKRGSNLIKWYFALEDNSRIGEDFSLVEQVGADEYTPLTKVKLKNRLENRGKLFDRQEDYKEYINQQIFGFNTMEQFEELIALLINLRSPKLSKDFRPTVIYTILRDSLPQLKEDELLPLAKTIEQLDDHHMRQEELTFEINELKNLVKRYQALNRELTGQIGYKWLKLDSEAKKKSQIKQSLIKETARLKEKLEQLAMEVEQNQQKLTILEAKHEDLSQHEGFSLVKRGQELQDFLNRSQRAVEQLERSVATKSQQIVAHREKAGQAERQLEEAREELTDILAYSDDYVADIYLDEMHEFYRKKLLDKITTSEFSYFQTELQKKSDHFQHVIGELKALDFLKEEMQEKNRSYGQTLQQYDELKRDHDHWQQIIVSEIDKWKTAFDRWSHQTKISISAQTYDQVFYLFNQLMEEELDSDYVLQPVRQAYEMSVQLVQSERLAAEQKLKQNQLQQEEIKKEINEWELSKIAEPPSSSTRKEHRMKWGMDDQWIPFYRAVDFKTEVSEEMKNQIEGALFASGILDAVLTDQSLDLSDDCQILPDPQLLALTLSDYLEVSSNLSPNMQELTANILQSILIDDLTPGLPMIGLDGQYQIANLRGKMPENYQASYIGASSQERFRQQKLAELRGYLAEIIAQGETICLEIEQLKEQQTQLTKEYRECPQGEEVYRAFKETQRLAWQLEAKGQEVEEKKAVLLKLDSRIQKETIELRDKTNKDGLDLTVESYQKGLENLQEYLRSMVEAHMYYEEGQKHQQTLDDISIQLSHLQDDLEDYTDRLDEERVESEKYEQLLAENQKQQELVHVDQLREALDETKKALQQTRRQLEENQQDRLSESQQFATKEEQLSQLTQQVERLEEEERLWRQLLMKQASMIEENLVELRDFAKELQSEPDINKVRQLETQFSQEYNRIADQLQNYRPRLETEVLIHLSEIEQQRYSDLASYNNQIKAYFEADKQKQDIFDLQQNLESQLEILKTLMERGDKELFEQIIFDSVGKILRARIEKAQKWVAQMNDLLLNQRNSSGLSLSIHWKEIAEDSAQNLGTKQLVRLLQKDPVTLSDSDIDAIIRHFQEKINYAQEKLLIEFEEGSTLYQAVAEVLDYRTWFDFELKFKRANEGYQWKPLSDNQFNIFSGGEKAIAMYLPLFAAVYSRYQDAAAEAPYIITLDEAFAGIDDLNIAELFKACEELGFNYAMNSQALYGEYATVSSLMTYELLRPLNNNFVSVIRYYWDGKKRSIVLEGDTDASQA